MTEEVGAKLLPHATDTYEMVNGATIDQFKGKQVTVVGKVEEAKGATFVMACHGGISINPGVGKKVKVTGFSDKPPLGEPISEGKIVEVRGALSEAGLAFHDLVVYGDDFGTPFG